MAIHGVVHFSHECKPHSQRPTPEMVVVLNTMYREQVHINLNADDKNSCVCHRLCTTLYVFAFSFDSIAFKRHVLQLFSFILFIYFLRSGFPSSLFFPFHCCFAIVFYAMYFIVCACYLGLSRPPTNLAPSSTRCLRRRSPITCVRV